MRGRKFYIYGLVDPRDYKVRYVGRTSQRMDKRLAHHIFAAKSGKKTPVYDWLRSLLPGQPRLVCLEICDKLVKGAPGTRLAQQCGACGSQMDREIPARLFQRSWTGEAQE